MRSSFFLFTSFTILLALASWVNYEVKYEPGSICTVKNGDGQFGVVKILVIDKKMAHVKVYKNTFNKRPNKIDISKLTMGSFYDEDGTAGIGHLPLKRKEFESWKPLVIGYEKVSKEDLEGYEIWRSQ